MVKTPYIIALCTLVIAGCQKEDIVKQGNGDGTVRYAVAMNQTVGTRAVDNGTVASGNVVSLKDRSGRLSIPMSSEVTEGILCASSTAVAQEATKGTLVNTSGSPQALSGFATAVGGVFAAKAYVGATEQLSQTITWNSLTSAWVGSPVAYWPQSTSLNFLACANIAAEDVDFASTGLTMDHTVPATAAAQTDILFGHYQGNGGYTGTAQIRFEHPLTAVRFLYGEIDGNLHIKSISLDGVAASGTAAMNVEGAITWSGVSDYSHIVSQINASGLPRTTLSGHTAQLIGESFIIIPQSLSAHEVTVTVTLSDDTVLEATLSADEWKAGCTNTYTLGYTNPSQVHFVDLGLPSGILWADKNVGATSVTDMGDHYPWGETEEWYSSLSASYDYTMKPKYSGGFTVANYNSLSNMKSINANLTGAYEQYDVAAATYGDGCRMPSNTEFDELKANCYWRAVTSYGGASVKGVVAFKVQDSSHKGKYNQSYDSSYNYDMPHIFIPDNGYGQNEVLRSGTIGSGPKGVNAGYYWLSDYTAHSFSFSSNLPSRLEDDSKRPRYLALGVRPVKNRPLPADVLPGLFSVSPTEYVKFSRGNLQATLDASGAPTEWKFARQQYEVLLTGGANKTIGTAAGDIDLFGWSGSTGAQYGISMSNQNSAYSGDFIDWGTAMDPCQHWITLSSAEWDYLAHTRITDCTISGVASARFLHCTVGSVSGLMLFPDEFVWPAGIELPPSSYINQFSADAYSCSLADFKILEQSGVVMLPVGGYRDDNYVTVTTLSVWSSTPSGSSKAYITTGWAAYINESARNFGRSVRLVQKFVKSHEYVEIGGLKWATCNIGADSPKEYGWYFSWAGTTGYVRDGSKWGIAQGGSELSGGFSWANTPYHTGSVETANWEKYIPTGRATYWSGGGSPDNKLSLELVDDAARANWGGSWRMPTQAEFRKLYEACGGTGANVGTPALPSANPGKGIYWVSNSQTYISDYNGVAGILFCDGTSKLFFAAAGYGDNTNFAGGGTEGRYWSGTVLSNPPSYAYRLGFQNGNVSPQNANGRNQGYPVRPVSD